MATYKYTGSSYENGEQELSTDDMITLIRNPELRKSMDKADALKRQRQVEKSQEIRKKRYWRGYKK
jgi:hypothetical protein